MRRKIPYISSMFYNSREVNREIKLVIGANSKWRANFADYAGTMRDSRVR
ncbi:hypothetical protein KSB_74970 [Ktedonobacter robiniae]|uniref:Uncharacterized protein n=1 Tax=Ktedonobacter robiniae TaxID=2778365 RepID=A0ABQ3V390_9CHLR|nr:hypothetical protein KSB_74970 [Ktedonobacter robiniae]